MSAKFKFKHKPENIKGEVKLYAKVFDSNGRILYYEDVVEWWEKYELYFENSKGCWQKLDGKEAKLKKSINLDDLELI